MDSKCPNCDLEYATDHEHVDGLCRAKLLDGFCRAPGVDWRARALAAETELAEVKVVMAELDTEMRKLKESADGLLAIVQRRETSDDDMRAALLKAMKLSGYRHE